MSKFKVGDKVVVDSWSIEEDYYFRNGDVGVIEKDGGDTSYLVNFSGLGNRFIKGDGRWWVDEDDIALAPSPTKYIIWNADDCSAPNPQFVHDTLVSAWAECQRLSKLYKNHTFHVCELKGSAIHTITVAEDVELNPPEGV